MSIIMFKQIRHNDVYVSHIYNVNTLRSLNNSSLRTHDLQTIYMYWFTRVSSETKGQNLTPNFKGTRPISKAFFVQRKLYRYICLILIEKQCVEV